MISIVYCLLLIILISIIYFSINCNTTSCVTKKPLKLQSKVDEWNKIYGKVDVASFDLGMESRNKKILFQVDSSDYHV
jgi:hypothetical protein